MASTLSPDEQEAVKTFMEELTKMQYARDPNNSPVSWPNAVKFLMARKFDVRRAIDLYNSHEMVRRKEGLKDFDPRDECIKRELYSEKLTVLPTRDEFGAAIALFTARIHHPTQSSHQSVLKALIFQLDVALESVETQRNGLVFIYDMTHSKYQNFDYELSIKILSMLKGSYPAKLKKVLIVTAPLWFKAPFKILRLFVREKLRDRVYTVSVLQLCHHIPAESLPRRFGGTLEINHRDWISHCLQTAWSSSPDVETEIAAYLEPMMSNHLLSMSSSTSTTASGDDACPCDWSDQLPADRRFNWQDGCFDFTGDLSDDWSGSLNSPLSPFSTVKNSSDRKRSADLSSPPTTVVTATNDHDPLTLPSKKRSGSADLDGNVEPESIHVPEPVGLTIKELVEYCRIKGRSGLYKEYAQLKAELPQGTFEVSKSKTNLSKNRYTDVLCLDETRVKLRPTPGDASSDYINANFVDGYKQKNAFISTQGPLPKTFPDFWKMVWEQKVLVVVMTTRTIERGRVKCGQYWPLDVEGIEQYENFVVINNGVETQENYIESILLLQNLETLETREVTHIQLTNWRDYDVPHSSDGFLAFMLHVRERQVERVRQMQSSQAGGTMAKTPPIVIHCSAGIGRTGTFIAMDINTRRLMDTGRVDVQKTVRRIRTQRAYSIQMPDQYVFCHMALIEYAQQQGILGEVEFDCFNDSSSESD